MMSVAKIERPVSIGLNDSLSDNGILDGALGDDERTETERSPQDEKDPFSKPIEGVPTAIQNDIDLDGEARNGDNSRLKGASKKHRRGKHKGGRRHGRQWKPYEKLTWDERKALEDRETKRACQRREQRFASGQPMAPYNTTQFLMEQNEDGFKLSEDIRPRANTWSSSKGDGSGSPESSDEYYDSPEDEDLFLTKEFAETYENCHAERLKEMTKEDLVHEYLELENKVETLERRIKCIQSPSKATIHDLEIGAGGPLPREDKIDIAAATRTEDEIIKLRRENEQLRRENNVLKCQSSATS